MMGNDHYYVLPEDVLGEQVIFRAGEAKHLNLVCRKGTGDVVGAVDGQGNEFAVVLEQISSQRVVGRVLRCRRMAREPVCRVTLAQAVTKGARLDLVVQEATELGVHRIIPMMTEHTVVSHDRLTSAKRRDRWQKIAISAMKQSLRSLLPAVEPPSSFQQVLARAKRADLALMATVVKDARSLEKVFTARKAPRDLLLMVGPEGGFSAGEITRAMQSGVELVSLGPRRLRSETAGTILVGLVLFQLGELG